MKGLEAALENGLFHMRLGSPLKGSSAVEWRAGGPLTRGLRPNLSEITGAVENPAAV